MNYQERLAKLKERKEARERGLEQSEDLIQEAIDLVQTQKATVESFEETIAKNDRKNSQNIAEMKDYFTEQNEVFIKQLESFLEGLKAELAHMKTFKEASASISMAIAELKDDIKNIKFDLQPQVTLNQEPAQVDISDESLNAYRPQDSDTKDNNEYHGYMKKNGEWYIMRVSHDDNEQFYRYVSGKKGYVKSWNTREKQSYQRINKAF